jgi:DNA-binding NarL/FixJ family response regulator
MSGDADVHILIVDDREFVRDALVLFVETQPSFKLIGQASDGEQAIRKCQDLNPDVVLIDIMMPGIGGVAAIREIRKRFPHIRVVAMTSHETEITRDEALAAGAHEFIIKDTTGETLANTIRTATRQ